VINVHIYFNLKIITQIAENPKISKIIANRVLKYWQ